MGYIIKQVWFFKKYVNRKMSKIKIRKQGKMVK